jgi:hypothetical protein
LKSLYRGLLALALLGAVLAPAARAGLVIGGSGGLVLVNEGGSAQGTAENIVNAANILAANEIGVAPHNIFPNLGDRQHGNASSWIAGAQSSALIVHFGGTTQTVSALAFGRDNTGVYADRALGLYEVQYTTVANPSLSTADENWTAIGTLDYQSPGGTHFAQPARRHVYNFTPVSATAIRLKMTAVGALVGDWLGIDEIEVFSGPQSAALPVVTSPTASGLAATTAILGATYAGSDFPPRGFALALASVNPAPQLGGVGVTDVVVPSGFPVFQGFPTGLTPGATYAYAAYAINGGGTGYGPTATFTTPSNNADLSAFTPALGALTPAFSPATTTYALSVPFSSVTTTLTPVTAHSGATIHFNGGNILSGQPWTSFDLVAGVNTNYSFVVTAQDGTTTKTYTLNITRATAAQSDAALSALVPSVGALVPAFAAGTTSYTFNVPHATTSLTLTPTLSSALSTIIINGVPVANNTASGALPLAVGANTLTVHVAAADGLTTRTYTVTVTRSSAAQSDASLAALTTSGGPLSPAFAAGTTAYSLWAANPTTSLTVTPTATQPGATILVNGVSVTSGTASSALPLAVGDNTIVVAITSPDGFVTRAHTLTATRATVAQSDAALSALVPSVGALVPAFAAGTTSYAFNVPHATTSLTLTPTLSSALSAITINGVPVANNTASGALPLAVGTNTLTVHVAAADGLTTRTYTVTAGRYSAAEEDTSLAVFATDRAGVTALGGDAYDQRLPYAIDTAAILATPTAPGASVTINGSAPASSYALLPGANVFNVQVTSANGLHTAARTLTIHRLPGGRLGLRAHGADLPGVRNRLAVVFDYSGYSNFLPLLEGVQSFSAHTPGGAGGGLAVLADGQAVTWGNPTYTVPTAARYDAREVRVTEGSIGNAALVVSRSGSLFSVATPANAVPPPAGLAGVRSASYLDPYSLGFHGLIWREDGSLAPWGPAGLGAPLAATAPVNSFTASQYGLSYAATLDDGGVIQGGGISVAGPALQIATGRDVALRLNPDHTVSLLGTANYNEFAFPSAALTGARAVAASDLATAILGQDGRLFLAGYSESAENYLPNGPFADVQALSLNNISAFALVRPTPRIAVRSTPVALTIANTGPGPLALQSATLSGTDAAHFTLGGFTSGSIPAGGTATLSITGPSGTTLRTARLTLVTDDVSTLGANPIDLTTEDLAAPVLTAPDIEIVSTTDAPVAVTFPDLVVTDDLDSAPSIVTTPAAGTLFSPGETVVQVTATDAAGRSTTGSFRVTVGRPRPVLLATGGGQWPGNLARSGTAFAQNALPAAPHAIANLKDGLHGNSRSWIAGAPASFFGVSLGSTPVPVGRIAWGRDNTGAFTDRWSARYTLEYTTTPHPTAATPDSAWLPFLPLDFPALSAAGDLPEPARRHVFSFGPVNATGLRVRLAAASDPVAIDELEVYAPAATRPDFTWEAPAGQVRTGASASHAFNAPAGAGLAATTVTVLLVNHADTPLALTSAAFLPGADSGFTLGAVPATVPARGSATLLVSVAPAPLGAHTATLRVLTGSTVLPQFDLALAATGIDTRPPVITPPATVTATATSQTGATVSFPAATVTDEHDPAPTVNYSPASGSTFALGTTTVTITATDAANNTATATFAVTVAFAPPVATATTTVLGATNLATPATAFALNVVGPPHSIAALNDGTFGNASSWLGSTAASFVGLNLGATPVPISRVAWSRDATGTLTDRALGLYTLQFTTTPNPSAATPDAAWTTLGVLDYTALAAASQLPAPAARHVWSFLPVEATGFRLLTQSPADGAPQFIAIDEFQLFGAPRGSTLVRDGASLPLTGHAIAFGNVAVGVAATRTLTLVNDSDAPLALASVALTGPQAAAFTHTLAATTPLAPGEARVFEVSLTASTLGAQAATLTLTTTAPDSRSYVLALSGTSTDTVAPVITPPGTVTATATSQTGATVTFASPGVTDNFDPAPVVSITPASGSTFALGATTVTITATDAANNTATASFDVVVTAPAPTSTTTASVLGAANLATPATAFALNVVGPPHSIAALNDGTFGNASSWLGSTAASFVGLNLGATPVPISRVAWSRDETGALFDRWRGTYTLQFTTTPNPSASTPDSAWTTLGALDYESLWSNLLLPAPTRRNVWSFLPVEATGFRLLVQGVNASPASFIAIDEFQLFGAPRGSTLVRDGASLPLTGHAIAFGDVAVGATATRTLTLVNDSDAPLALASVALTGPQAAAFAHTLATTTPLAPNETRAFEVTLTPATLGAQATTLTLTTAAPDSRAYVLALSGTSTDTVAPVITPPGTVTATATSQNGATVSFPAATVTDDLDPAPTVTYSHASGSTFALGATTVTITATDAANNTATASFQVVVTIPAPVATTATRVFGAANLATPATAFALNVAGPPHSIAALNDGLLGNAHSWIAGSYASFVGLNFGATPVRIGRVAWSRDETGVLFDRWRGTYTLQFTTTSNPSASTPDSAWITLGALDYNGLWLNSLLPAPTRRNVWSFLPVEATGFRLLAQRIGNPFDPSTFDLAIDELQLFAAPRGSALVRDGASLPLTGHAIAFGNVAVGVAATRTLTLVNDSDAPLALASVALTGPQVAAFAHTLATATPLAPGEARAFEISLTPATLGTHAATFTLTTAAPDSRTYTFALVGTGADLAPPVLSPPADITMLGAGLGGVPVTFSLPSVTDDHDPAPTLTASPPSGSVFPLGFTPVTVTATDAAGNSSTATFKVQIVSRLASGGSALAGNLALAATPAAKDLAGPPHSVSALNDGLYGNSSSWLGATSPSHVVLNLGATPVNVGRVAWGRDNTGAFTDRWAGAYVLQFTTTPNPSAATPDSAWSPLLTLTYDSALATTLGGSLARRHLWAVPTVAATGLRLVVQSAGDLIAIDEFEAYAPLNPLAEWRATHFGAATALTGHTEDFDGDGVANLLEFAFGTTPTTAGSGARPLSYAGNGITPGAPLGDATHATFVRRKDHAAADLTYTVRFSTTLATWTDNTTTPEVLADDGTHQVVRVPYPYPANQARKFFRVVVTAAE